jgi:hypothetical protein
MPRPAPLAAPLTARLAACLLLALVCACACGRRDARAGESAVVVGTVLDAATGTPLSGVRLEGPNGTSATSERDGRFELEGLHAGDRGELVARTDDGRRGSVTLRPLAKGRIEVVVHLYRR